MSKIVLTKEEANSLAMVLKQVVIKARTGEIGIIHGADRFVSTSVIMRKADLNTLKSSAIKIGANLESIE